MGTVKELWLQCTECAALMQVAKLLLREDGEFTTAISFSHVKQGKTYTESTMIEEGGRLKFYDIDCPSCGALGLVMRPLLHLGEKERIKVPPLQSLLEDVGKAGEKKGD